MKILFQKEGRKIRIIDKEQLRFKVDGKFINGTGGEIPEEEDFQRKSDEYDAYDDDQWYEEWIIVDLKNHSSRNRLRNP